MLCLVQMHGRLTCAHCFPGLSSTFHHLFTRPDASDWRRVPKEDYTCHSFLSTLAAPRAGILLCVSHVTGRPSEVQQPLQTGARPRRVVVQIIISSLGELFNSATAIMHWLSECARIIAASDEPVRWTTPLGLPVVQPYRCGASLLALLHNYAAFQMFANRNDCITMQNLRLPRNCHDLDIDGIQACALSDLQHNTESLQMLFVCKAFIYFAIPTSHQENFAL